MAEQPFDSIESALEYVTLLAEQVETVKAGIADDLRAATTAGGGRQVDALRLVEYKLKSLAEDLARSRRTLRELRHLRRVLLGGADDETPVAHPARALSDTTEDAAPHA